MRCSLPLLDVWMPETSVLEVQARLHEMSPDAKVIVMSGRETPAIHAAALEGGAFAFLPKPFDVEAFLSLIRQGLPSATGNDTQTRHLTTKMGKS
jgi:two-component system nitrogen regulation response regulator GlnG